MNNDKRITCPDCESGWTRRDFVKAVGGAAIAAGAMPLVHTASAAPTATSTAETAAKRLFESLNDEQRKVVCFDFDHPLRQTINANWSITKPTIGDFFTKDQQATID